MALYNVESPGGYQMTGLTIPCVDILGSKLGYSLSRPWLFEDFDLLTFHEVEEEEYERQLKLFNSGRHKYEWEEVIFDMEEHHQLLEATRGEVKEVRRRQREAQGKMVCLLAPSLFREVKRHRRLITAYLAQTRRRTSIQVGPRESRRQNPRRRSRGAIKRQSPSPAAHREPLPSDSPIALPKLTTLTLTDLQTHPLTCPHTANL